MVEFKVSKRTPTIIAFTGKVASGKSYISKAFFESLADITKTYVDLDEYCKQLPIPDELIGWLDQFSTNAFKNDFSDKATYVNFILDNVFPYHDRYEKFCSFYSEHLENYVKHLANTKTTVVIEASALWAYPNLLKYCDYIIEVQASGSLQFLRFERRHMSLPLEIRKARWELLNNLYLHYRDKAIMIHQREPDLTYWNDYDERSIPGRIEELTLATLTPYTAKYKPAESCPKTIGLFCGSFDPFTIGHRDIYKKAKKLFEIVLIVRAKNPAKPNFAFDCPQADFTTDYIPHAIDHARTHYAGRDVALIRGVRNAEDYTDAKRWHKSIELVMQERFDLVLLQAAEEHKDLSSSFVRAVYKLDEERASKFMD